MLKLKQVHRHEMKMGGNFRSNPVGAELKWPKSPRVVEGDIDCVVETHVTQDALIIPVDYLRKLMETANPEFRDFINGMISILMKDQENLTGTIEFTGFRKHYH